MQLPARRNCPQTFPGPLRLSWERLRDPPSPSLFAACRVLLVVLLYDARLAAGSRLEQYRSISAPIFVLKRRCCRSALQNKLLLVVTGGEIQSLAPKRINRYHRVLPPCPAQVPAPNGGCGKGRERKGSLEALAFSWGRSRPTAAGLRDAELCLKGAPGGCRLRPGKRSAERGGATSPHRCRVLGPRRASAASLAHGEAVRGPGGVSQLSASLGTGEGGEMPPLQRGEQS